jgi:hypothetical protein
MTHSWIEKFRVMWSESTLQTRGHVAARIDSFDRFNTVPGFSTGDDRQTKGRVEVLTCDVLTRHFNFLDTTQLYARHVVVCRR